jgi:C4-dicarboxylate-specific signal transduction histidine kinase
MPLNRELREELGRRVEELRAAHAEAMRNERLAALGTLAAGVAHDLNNPLMGVITHVQVRHAENGYRRRAGARRAREGDEVLETLRRHRQRPAGVLAPQLAAAGAETDLRGNIYRAVDEAVPIRVLRATRVRCTVALELEPRAGRRSFRQQRHAARYSSI